jgi:hypothetical protein
LLACSRQQSHTHTYDLNGPKRDRRILYWDTLIDSQDIGGLALKVIRAAPLDRKRAG